MNVRGRTPGRSARRIGAALLLPLAVAGGARGDGAPPADPGRTEAPGPLDLPTTSAAAPAIRYDGTPTPGARISVGLEHPAGPDASYEWTQVDGPAVVLADRSGPRIELTVPPGARSLGFRLAIRDPKGQKAVRISVPIRQAGEPASAPPEAPRADAGDDQIGLVGRRITLNGSRSTPRGGVAYRWLVLSGPGVEPVAQDGEYFTFTPRAPGVYRFGLVVASADAGAAKISGVDETVVTVGEPPPAVRPGAAPGAATAAIDQMLQGPGAASARTTLEQTAAAFDAIAARASLYTSFAELSAEMIRRVDAAVPVDPNWRQFWSQGVFAPLTQHVVSEMLTTGLDLRSPQGMRQELNPPQQDRIQKLFASYAREFRSRAQDRPAP